jgi:hypothetical protein
MQPVDGAGEQGSPVAGQAVSNQNAVPMSAVEGQARGAMDAF